MKYISELTIRKDAVNSPGEEIAAPLSCSLSSIEIDDPCPLALREAFLYGKPFDYRIEFTPFISKVVMGGWALESLNPRILEPFIKKI